MKSKTKKILLFIVCIAIMIVATFLLFVIGLIFPSIKWILCLAMFCIAIYEVWTGIKEYIEN